MTTHDFAARQSREADVITTVLAVPCGLACAGSVIPGLDAAVTTVLLALVVLAALVLLGAAGRWAARWLRERQEDAADALTAARWRAVHAPHLLTTADRTQLGIPPAVTVTGLDVRGPAVRMVA
jgi:hypothetical protein